MTDVDSKLAALLAAPALPPDEAFVARVSGAIVAEQRIRAARDAMWRRFAIELAGTVSVVGAFYLLWNMAPSNIDIEPLLPAPGIAAGMILLLWLGVQWRPSAADG